MMIFHISDTHLGKRQYNLETREKDVYDTFRQLVDIAINEHVDAIIHTGDLFDISDPPNKAEHIAYNELKRLKEKGIPFISIPGDHDTPKRKGDIYPQYLLFELGLLELLLDPLKPYILSKEGITINIYGFKHIPTISRNELLKYLDALKPQQGKNIIMLHQGFKEILPYMGSWQLSFSNLPRGFSYYACGHFHMRYLHRNNDGSIVAIAGSPDIMREEEIENYLKNGKGAYLVDLSKDQPEVQKINTDIRPQEVVTINTKRLDENINQLTNKYKKYSKKPILHIIIEGEPIRKDTLYSKLQKLQEVAEHYRVIKDLTSVPKDIKSDKEKGDVHNNLDDLIIRYLTKEYEYKFTEEEAKDVLELIRNLDNEQVVEEILKKIAGV